MPLAIVQLRVFGRHAPLSMWKPALQLDGVHVPHVVEPAAQLCVPVPLAIVQLRVPAGLLQACESVAAPHAAESVGVQACVVLGVPVQLAVPVGVQLCVVDGRAAVHRLSATVLPRLSLQITSRDCEPLSASHPQLELRVWLPLLAVKLQLAVRA